MRSAETVLKRVAKNLLNPKRGEQTQRNRFETQFNILLEILLEKSVPALWKEEDTFNIYYVTNI